MDVSKNKANITTPFLANLFPIKIIISPNFYFCLNAYLNFSFYILGLDFFLPNKARYFQIRQVKQSHSKKSCKWIFFRNI